MADTSLVELRTVLQLNSSLKLGHDVAFALSPSLSRRCLLKGGVVTRIVPSWSCRRGLDPPTGMGVVLGVHFRHTLACPWQHTPYSRLCSQGYDICLLVVSRVRRRCGL